MIDIKYEPTHHIQHYILDVLRHNEFARFRDLRPPRTDSNLFSYHLGQLLKNKFVAKTDRGYSLSLHGLVHIDRVSSISKKPRQQPKIMTISVIMNEHNEVLVRYKTSQPMINKVTFVAGMQHLEDATIEQAALREIREKSSLELPGIAHIGDCYMAIRHDGVVIMNTLMHVFLATVKKAAVHPNDTMFWRKLHDLSDAAPATLRITQELQERDADKLFFREYVDDL